MKSIITTLMILSVLAFGFALAGDTQSGNGNRRIHKSAPVYSGSR